MDGVPAHIGIIMDGNGRWAKRRGLARTQGHLEGLNAAKRIVKAAVGLGVKYLTLYAFSTENWKRAQEEVSFIMGLVTRYLRAEMDFYKENGIRIRHTGDFAGLPESVQKELLSSMSDTACFKGMQVVLAVNYGGRDEITRAFKRLAASFAENSYMESVTEKNIQAFLDNPDIPDPDLIIRSAGECRMSNFLLWESAYAEFYFSKKLWPDWEKEDLEEAVADFKARDRRYGGLAA
ncbi:MAG: di-trans,poly-cis-decaprenylcistransferase [Treponema sp.]|jgi:undecaprenyl diphosphate synthase|nr:di-trans,poly-cis-decaprenylcistransferase [Treponema sp.]